MQERAYAKQVYKDQLQAISKIVYIKLNYIQWIEHFSTISFHCFSAPILTYHNTHGRNCLTSIYLFIEGHRFKWKRFVLTIMTQRIQFSIPRISPMDKEKQRKSKNIWQIRPIWLKPTFEMSDSKEAEMGYQLRLVKSF